MILISLQKSQCERGNNIQEKELGDQRRKKGKEIFLNGKI